MYRPIEALMPVLAVLSAGPLMADESLPPPRQRELLHLVRHDCGSCHGLTMKGGLGPPLVPEAVAAKDPELMRAIILHGLRGTPMPPWRPFLTDDEAMFVVQLLKKGLPDER